MIKFVANSDSGRTLIGLGLSAGNLQRLKEGKPIHIHFEEINLPWNASLMIMYGDTEDAMKEELKEFIGPETVVIADRSKQ